MYAALLLPVGFYCCIIQLKDCSVDQKERRLWERECLLRVFQNESKNFPVLFNNDDSYMQFSLFETELSDDFDVEFKEKSQSDFVEIKEKKNSAALGQDGLTIALWVKPDYRFNTGTIMTYLVPDNSSEQIEISFTESLIRALVRSDIIEGSAHILDGKWHFIGITWSNKEGLLMMYVDGQLISVIHRTPGKASFPSMTKLIYFSCFLGSLF
jgi:hypothetical protein